MHQRFFVALPLPPLQRIKLMKYKNFFEELTCLYSSDFPNSGSYAWIASGIP